MIAAAAIAFLPVSRRRLIREVVRQTTDEAVMVDASPAGDEPAVADAGPAANEVAADHAPAGSTPAGRAPLAVLECVEVSRSFGGVRALQGVSLTIGQGELIGLVGPNGSGKTTLVNVISGAFRPSTGDVRLDDRTIVGLQAHRIAHLGIARTYQVPRPFESMTVRDNVAIAIMFGRAAHSLAAARRAADRQLELVGLLHLAAARPAEINLHERQLLEMARALATRPRVLLLDEALAGLSPVEIDNAAAVVRRIHASGVTIVLVEHLLRVVNQLATRIVVLDQGRSIADGRPTVVMRDPAVVSAYLGGSADA
jgi:branched-chain amino acid transport system permease protein